MSYDDLEIGRSPGGDTDFGQYIANAIRSAEAGRHIRLLLHGKPVARIIPAQDDDGPGSKGWALDQARQAEEGLKAARELAGLPPVPRIVCLCGSSRFYAQFQQAYYDRTMRGEIVLSIGFYPHATAEHGHGEDVGHDSDQKVMLDELHKRKVDLADYVLVVSDSTGYFGSSTTSEIRYALEHGKPVEFTESAARERCLNQVRAAMLPGSPS